MLEIKADVRIESHFHQHTDVGASGKVLELLRAIQAQGEKIMSQNEDALVAIVKIEEATTRQGVQLGTIGDILQETSDDIDALITELGTSVTPETLSRLKAVADKQQVISDQLDAHAEFSKGIAAKWPKAPPVPPTPPPDPPIPTA